MTLVSDTTSICTDVGSASKIGIRFWKKVWIKLFFRINSVKYKNQLLFGTFESKGAKVGGGNYSQSKSK